MKAIPVGKNLFEEKDGFGQQNRDLFKSLGLYVFNLMSAPGAGKTSLLERTLVHFADRYRIAVIEGDIQSSLDADRLKGLGADIRQINTHGACHLDPRLITDELQHFPLESLDTLIVENVGNLVCPAEFDLGETSVSCCCR